VAKICDFGLSGHGSDKKTVSIVTHLAKGGKHTASLTSASIRTTSLTGSTLKMISGGGGTVGSGGGSGGGFGASGTGDIPPGSLFWMAPEVARGQPYSPAADVYSFAITMWEVLTRQIPYGGDRPEVVIQQVLSQGRRPEIPSDIPEPVASLIRQGWAEDPAARPTFKEIVTRLNAVLGVTGGGGSTMSGGATMGGFSGGTGGGGRFGGGGASAPTGTVTLVFTDVQGSTELWEHNPSAMRIALGLHNATARQKIREHSGYEVKTEGDAFMVAFARPRDALDWACALQLALVDLDWPEALLDHPAAARVANASSANASDKRIPAGAKRGAALLYAGLRVRIGMHTAKVQAQLDARTHRMDYFGRGVNKAARVSGKAHGGQVLLSGECLQALGGEDALGKDSPGGGGISVASLGAVHLKGIAEPVDVFQAEPAALRARTFAPIIGGGGTSVVQGGTRVDHLGSIVIEGATGSGATGAGAAIAGGAFAYSEVLGRIEAVVKKQPWIIDMSHVTLGKIIGQGSFGEVRLGKFRGQAVAVKSLLAHRLSEQHRMSFLEEMTTISHLRHANIVMFHGASVTPPAIVTEFADRGSLADILATNRSTRALSTRDKTRIALQISSAMLYLASHDPPLLHRDLKSANVLICGEANTAKICDFGLATARRASSTMSAIGTAGFMAPEVLSGDNYASSADVFAFGVLLYELIAETLPFQGLPSIRIGQAVLKGERARLPATIEVKPEFAGLIRLMKDCWAQDPLERPSFEDVSDRLSAMM
jgi:serine/threonine protein kinase/class 3 adenylate cyclase